MSKRVPVSQATREYDKLLGFWPGAAQYLPRVTSASDRLALQIAAETLPPGLTQDQVAFTLATLHDEAMLNPEDVAWLARWSKCRQVYRIAPEVAEEIKYQGIDAEMPVEAIQRMPYPVIYIDTPCDFATSAGVIPACGFLAWLDTSIAISGEHQLVLCFLFKEGKRKLLALSLECDTLDAVIENLVSYDIAMRERIEAQDPNHVQVQLTDIDDERACIAQALNLLLYVINEEIDVEVTYRPPSASRGQKVGRRTNPETHRLLGARMGRAIGEARRATGPATKGDGTRTVSPHIRRAHWQRFWRGKRKGREDGRYGDELILKWIPPVYVNGAGEPIEIVHESR